jgi:hypothetical protein
MPSDPPPKDETPPAEHEPQPALRLTLDLPREGAGATPAAVGAPHEGDPVVRAARGIVLRIVATALVLGVIVTGVAYALLPRWVKAQVIEGAAQHGVTLTADDASFDGTAFRLTGLRASAADLPGASAQAPELLVETHDLKVTKLTVRGAVLAFDGPWSHVDAAIDEWRSASHGGTCTDCMPTEVVVEGSRVVWTHPLADSGGIEANDVHLGGSFRGSGAEVHVSSSKVSLEVPGGKLGPWRVDVDRTPGASRIRVALDPAVPESSSILIVGDDERTSHVDVVFPRSPPARLGLPPAVLGLPGKDLQIEASIHYSDLGGGHAEASTTGGIHGVEAAGVPRALDVTWEASASGDPRKGMDVKRARLAAGPLVGALTGTLTTFDDGFRVELAWGASPVPCNAFEAPLDSGQPFDIAYQLRRLAEATGITKVTGTVAAHGNATFDSRDLGSTKVAFVPEVSCQVALFAR